MKKKGSKKKSRQQRTAPAPAASAAAEDGTWRRHLEAAHNVLLEHRNKDSNRNPISDLRGFQRFGKIPPHTPRHELYRAIIFKLMGNTTEDCNDDPVQSPLYNMLSPHRRVILLSDLAAGLLCPLPTPFPPDTPHHWAALLAVQSFLHTLLEIETDTEEEILYDYDGPAYRPEPLPPTAEEAELARRRQEEWDKRRKAGHGSLFPTREEKEAALRRHALENLKVRQAKKLNDTELRAAVAASSSHAPCIDPADVNSVINWANATVANHRLLFAYPTEAFSSHGQPQLDPPQEVLRSLPVVTHAPWAFATRGLLLLCLRDWNDARPAAREDGLECRVDYCERDSQVWYKVLDMLGLVGAPELNLTIEDERLLHGPVHGAR